MEKFSLRELSTDFSKAINWLLMVNNHSFTVSVEDTMCAYMIAHEWYKKIKCGSYKRLMFGRVADHNETLNLLQTYIKGFEQELLMREYLVKESFKKFRPQINGDDEAKLYNRTRFLTALLYSKHGNNSYAKIIKTKFSACYVKEKYLNETGEIAFRLWMFANAIDALSYNPNYEKAMHLKEKMSAFLSVVEQKGTKADKDVMAALIGVLP